MPRRGSPTSQPVAGRVDNAARSSAVTDAQASESGPKGRCFRPSVTTVGRKPRCRFRLARIARYTAESVWPATEVPNSSDFGAGTHEKERNDGRRRFDAVHRLAAQQRLVQTSSTPSAPKSPVTRKPRKLGRNERCWCVSGKKYKKCHLDRDHP